MSLLSAIILGVVQGLTEFLPVSSSGHLVLGQSLLNVSETGLVFEVAVHLGTLLAVTIFYRKDLYELILSLPTLKKPDFQNDPRHNLILALAIVTVITGIVGVSGKSFFEGLFSEPKIVSGLLIATGLFLIATRFIRDNASEGGRITPLQAIIVGLAQSTAILPGISRSGATISAGLFAGVGREEAARLSFLAMIPAVFGAALLEAKDITSFEGSQVAIVIAGLVVSSIVGYGALALLIRFVKRGKLFIFGPYCITVGVLGLLFL